MRFVEFYWCFCLNWIFLIFNWLFTFELWFRFHCLWCLDAYLWLSIFIINIILFFFYCFKKTVSHLPLTSHFFSLLLLFNFLFLCLIIVQFNIFSLALKNLLPIKFRLILFYSFIYTTKFWSSEGRFRSIICRKSLK